MRDDEDQLPDDDLSAAEGEFVDIDDAESDVVDTDDGGAIVRLDEDDAPGAGEFYANIVEDLPTSDQSRISSQMLQLFERDKEARKRRDEQYEEGIRRTGMGDDAPGGAKFQGASKVVHPMMTEACVDFASRTIKELWPASGPVKDHIEGVQTGEKLAKAKRKTALMNWQLTVQAQEARSEVEQLLTQVPLGGAQYLKLGWREDRNRPNFLFVGIDDMLLPFAATNFYSAQRKTHVQYLTQLDYEDRVKTGMYIDVDLSPAGMSPEQSAAGVATDKVEGRDASSYNEDGLRTVFESYATIDLSEFDDSAEGPAPYIISIDKPTGKVLAIYRNWDEEDDTREELQWFVEYPFVPWRGAYPIGLPQMIGGLSGAATGALRALLDSAHIQNTPSGLKLKGGGRGGQSLNIQPTEIKEIEGGINTDDIRKLFMPMPFNGPSPTLFQLLGFLVDAGKGVVRTTLDDAMDTNPNTPVGTTLARMEQGMVVYGAIHGRLHDAMGRMLRILHRLNKMYLDDERLDAEVGEKLATRSDFEGPMDVVPVSDPNIFSETQRYGQVQAVAQRAAALPQLYDARKVEERLLNTLKIPNYKELLAPDLTPKERNAVDENAAASLGQPVAAFADQNHMAHIQTHLQYMLSPLLGGNPLIAPTALPALLDHVKQHIVLLYATGTFHVGSGSIGEDLGEVIKDMPKDDKTQQAMDAMLAEASATAINTMTPQLQQLLPILQQLQQQAQAMMPPPQQDPKIALEGQKLQQKSQADAQKLQFQQQESQQDAQLEAQKLGLKGQELAQKGQLAQQDAQNRKVQTEAQVVIAAQREQHEDARSAAELNAKLTMNQQDNETAATIAAAELETEQQTALSTGTSINPTP